MKPTDPHYVLISETADPGRETDAAGHWRITLCSTGGDEQLCVEEREPGVRGERLELMAIVRGLEALDQPSRVTLWTESRHVRAGLDGGLDLWRENRWRWERFGSLVPIRHADLWRRIDRALQFHEVACRTWRGPHSQPGGVETATEGQAPVPAAASEARVTRRRPRLASRPPWTESLRHKVQEAWTVWRLSLGPSAAAAVAWIWLE